MPLPAPFDRWFDERGWSLHPHQAEMLGRADLPALLLVAPTGVQPAEHVLAEVVGDLRIPGVLDLGVGEEPVLHDLRGP